MGTRASRVASRARSGAKQGEEYRIAGPSRSERRQSGTMPGHTAGASWERARGACVRVGTRLSAPKQSRSPRRPCAGGGVAPGPHWGGSLRVRAARAMLIGVPAAPSRHRPARPADPKPLSGEAGPNTLARCPSLGARGARVDSDGGGKGRGPHAARTTSAHTLESEGHSTGASIATQMGESLGTGTQSPSDRVVSGGCSSVAQPALAVVGAAGADSSLAAPPFEARLAQESSRKSPPSRIPEESVESSCEGSSQLDRRAASPEDEPAGRERVAAGLTAAAESGCGSGNSSGAGGDPAQGRSGSGSPPLLVAHAGEGDSPLAAAPAVAGPEPPESRPNSEPFLRLGSGLSNSEATAASDTRFHSERSFRDRLAGTEPGPPGVIGPLRGRRPVRWQCNRRAPAPCPSAVTPGAALVSDYIPREAEEWASVGHAEEASAAGSQASFEPTANSAHSLYTESEHNSPSSGRQAGSGGGPRCAPSGVWLRYAAGTVAGRKPSGEVKRNQDAYLVLHRVGGIANSHLFAVMDGHGPEGHRVSAFVRRTLGEALGEQLTALPAQHVVWDPRRHFHTHKERDMELRLLAQAFRRAVTAVEARLEGEKAADTTLSGTTLVAALLIGRHAVLANVGDSRCVVGRRSRAPHHGPAARPDLVALAVTEDHKPSDPQEGARIRRRGGVVQPLRDRQTGLGMGPSRVWSPYGGGRGPGIAMSRSIGDRIAADVGVISDPVVTYHFLRPERHRCLVLASDGVWEFMSNEEAVQTAMSSAEPSAAAVAVCERAQRHWRDAMAVMGSHMADDITALVLHLWPDRRAAETAQPGGAAGLEGAVPTTDGLPSPSTSEHTHGAPPHTASTGGAEPSATRSMPCRMQLPARSHSFSPSSRGSRVASSQSVSRRLGRPRRLGAASQSPPTHSSDGKPGSPTGLEAPPAGEAHPDTEGERPPPASDALPRGTHAQESRVLGKQVGRPPNAQGGAGGTPTGSAPGTGEAP